MRWKRNVNTLLQSSSHCFINVSWPVCRTKYHDNLILIYPYPIHLRQQHPFGTTRGLMLLTPASLLTQGIDFVNKDGARRVMTSHFEQDANQLLTITASFTRQGGRGDVEEGGVALRRYRLCQHCLTGARRAIHQHPFPWPTNTLVVIWHEYR